MDKTTARIISGLMREAEAAKAVIQETDEAMKQVLTPLIPEGDKLEDYQLQQSPTGLVLVKVEKKE
jgi:hypothetical protein